MSSAIPLSAPDGTVYAYACGTCHHIGLSGAYLVPHGPEEIANLAETSKKNAESCCRCEVCGVVMGPSSLTAPHVCAACRPAHEAEMAERHAKIAAGNERRERVRAEKLALSKDALAARILAARMRDISEEGYCAGWLDRLEFSLWAMVQGGERVFGAGEVSEVEVDELRDLSEKCGGWFRYEDGVGEVFVPTAEWMKLYDAEVSK